MFCEPDAVVITSSLVVAPYAAPFQLSSAAPEPVSCKLPFWQTSASPVIDAVGSALTVTANVSSALSHKFASRTFNVIFCEPDAVVVTSYVVVAPYAAPFQLSSAAPEPVSCKLPFWHTSESPVITAVGSALTVTATFSSALSHKFASRTFNVMVCEPDAVVVTSYVVTAAYAPPFQLKSVAPEPVNCNVPFWHTDASPVITAVGSALTVTAIAVLVVLVQPLTASRASA